MAEADGGRMAHSSGRGREAWFGRLGHREVALPALVLELDVLDRYRVRVGVQLRDRLVFRDPAAIDLVGDRHLAGLVVDLEDDVLEIYNEAGQVAIANKVYRCWVSEYQA